MKRGVFISVDGPNCVGKSTFIGALSEKLNAIASVYTTREPSPSQYGDFVKRNEQHLEGLRYAHLLWSDRYFHIEKYILPQLKSGKVVLCDRYIESSLVLQKFDGISTETIWDENKEFLVPDISVVLFAKPEVLEKRLQERKCLSSFEKRMTRKQEVEGYREAIDFLSKKGFRHLILENNTSDDLERNVSEVYNQFSSLMR